MDLVFAASIGEIGETRSVGREARRAVAVRTSRQRPVVFSVARYHPQIAEALVDHLVAPVQNVNDALAVLGDLRIRRRPHLPESVRCEFRLRREHRRASKQQHYTEPAHSCSSHAASRSSVGACVSGNGCEMLRAGDPALLCRSDLDRKSRKALRGEDEENTTAF